MARATGSLDSPAAFRIPYGLFYVVPAIVVCGTWFVPEVRNNQSRILPMPPI